MSRDIVVFQCQCLIYPDVFIYSEEFSILELFLLYDDYLKAISQLLVTIILGGLGSIVFSYGFFQETRLSYGQFFLASLNLCFVD